MDPSPTQPKSLAGLKAVYSSSSGERDLAYPLSTGDALNKAAQSDEPTVLRLAKTAYLSELRSLVKTMQGEINMYLTEKMEEDKKHVVTNGEANGKDKEETEEEKYGEDVEEEG